MTGAALPDGETEVIYHYTVGASAINFKTRTHGGALPSITPLVPAANWIEREIHDLFKADFPGHPKLERLIRPPQLAEGFFR
jgi:NADH-quinone oxidoreductase subunit C